MDELQQERASKRRKIDTTSNHGLQEGGPIVRSYERSISPPARSRHARENVYSSASPTQVMGAATERSAAQSSVTQGDDGTRLQAGARHGGKADASGHGQAICAGQTMSPFRLTRIAELDDVANNDTISLHDILGDPDLSSVWLFDYLFDIHFVMSHIHKSPHRQTGNQEPVKVYMIHGSWKKDSPHRMRLDEQKQVYANAVVRHVYWPEPFGTHHSKMMVLFKRRAGRDVAQVIIHTANMISFDWANMTQGVWTSPWLFPVSQIKTQNGAQPHAIGTGERFKVDLLRYLGEYKHVTRELVSQLQDHDFGSIRAAFVASAPSRDKLVDARPSEYTSFGWPGLRQVIKAAINVDKKGGGGSDSIVMQISSIATISERWLRDFVDVLHTSTSSTLSGRSGKNKDTKIIWPTVDEVRNSLNGYESGGSIHLKSDSAAQKKQLAWLRKYWHRWSNDSLAFTSNGEEPQHPIQDAMRSLAAPHVKTYIRYDEGLEHIKWALLTSANLSTQAWGASLDKEGKVRISSWEVGVMVWPELYGNDEQQDIRMVPVFGSDGITKEQQGNKYTTGDEATVPLRIPYGLPLCKYKDDDEPWCKTETYMIPDSRGMKWET